MGSFRIADILLAGQDLHAFHEEDVLAARIHASVRLRLTAGSLLKGQFRIRDGTSGNRTCPLDHAMDTASCHLPSRFYL